MEGNGDGGGGRRGNTTAKLQCGIRQRGVWDREGMVPTEWVLTSLCLQRGSQSLTCQSSTTAATCFLWIALRSVQTALAESLKPLVIRRRGTCTLGKLHFLQSPKY